MIGTSDAPNIEAKQTSNDRKIDFWQGSIELSERHYDDAVEAASLLYERDGDSEKYLDRVRSAYDIYALESSAFLESAAVELEVRKNQAERELYNMLKPAIEDLDAIKVRQDILLKTLTATDVQDAAIQILAELNDSISRDAIRDPSFGPYFYKKMGLTKEDWLGTIPYTQKLNEEKLPDLVQELQSIPTLQKYLTEQRQLAISRNDKRVMAVMSRIQAKGAQQSFQANSAPASASFPDMADFRAWSRTPHLR